jgi:tryptophan synthase beta chain
LDVGRSALDVFPFVKPIQQVPDSHGHFGPYGGMFVPETLMSALNDLTAEY